MKFGTSSAQKNAIDDICMIDRIVLVTVGSTIKTCSITS
jgi:hypothetical protein